MVHWTGKLLAIPLLVMTLSHCYCQDQTNEESNIRRGTQAYVDAFNQHNADALANFLSDDALYVNPETGSTIEGRQAIKENYEDLFSNSSNAQLKVQIDSIRFPAKDHAIERGIATVTVPGEQDTESSFIVHFSKTNGAWKITRISEEDIVEPPSHYENLKALEWLIGTWVDENEDSTVKLDYQWDDNKNFIVLNYSVAVHGRKENDGQQYIGWDEFKKAFRSWLFDSNGGVGEGTWHKKGDKWVVDSAFTNSDGTRASATNTYTMLTNDSFSWESINREVDGEIMPNIPPMKIIRKKG